MRKNKSHNALNFAHEIDYQTLVATHDLTHPYHRTQMAQNWTCIVTRISYQSNDNASRRSSTTVCLMTVLQQPSPSRWLADHDVDKSLYQRRANNTVITGTTLTKTAGTTNRAGQSRATSLLELWHKFLPSPISPRARPRIFSVTLAI